MVMSYLILDSLGCVLSTGASLITIAPLQPDILTFEAKRWSPTEFLQCKFPLELSLRELQGNPYQNDCENPRFFPVFFLFFLFKTCLSL